MAQRDLVVVGASAGGVDALMRLARGVDPNLPAAVLVVLHVPPDSHSNLPLILSRSGALPASHAVDGQRIEPGRILVAPPDRHLLVDDGRVRVTRGPHENLHRPAVDVLFRSAAIAHGSRTIGVVLSGALDDGAFGLRILAAAGAITVVQDPSDAIVPSMPQSALEAARIDHVLPADAIGQQLSSLLLADTGRDTMDDHARESLAAENDMSAIRDGPSATAPGTPSTFGCPDCGGVLWEVGDKTELRFRCRVGHAYTARSLLAAENAGLEDALWAALRALEEQEALTRRLLAHGWPGTSDGVRDRLEERARTLQARTAVLRQFLLSPGLEIAGDDVSEAAIRSIAAADSAPDAAASAGLRAG